MASVQTAAKALIWSGGRLLVVHYRDERGDWFALPGGGQAHGAGLPVTLQRELAEELGVTARVGRLCFVRECIAAFDPEGRLRPDFHQVEHVFFCELIGELAVVGPQPDPGQVGVEWHSVEELRAVQFYPQALLDALDRAEFGYLGVV
jgi:8-oxo-dGTP pyrophosphatase MutT (NUDIX family)